MLCFLRMSAVADVDSTTFTMTAVWIIEVTRPSCAGNADAASIQNAQGGTRATSAAYLLLPPACISALRRHAKRAQPSAGYPLEKVTDVLPKGLASAPLIGAAFVPPVSVEAVAKAAVQVCTMRTIKRSHPLSGSGPRSAAGSGPGLVHGSASVICE